MEFRCLSNSYLFPIDQALGLMDDATIKGTKVILETRDEQKRVGQEWFRSKLDSEGWFTLKNPISGRYLTAASNISTTITGILFIIIIDK
jgi:hypothetical protein